MRTVVSSTHPDPTRAVPLQAQHDIAQPSPPPPIDNAALDPALADSIPPPMQYSPQVMPNPPSAPASAQQLSQSGTLPPMQHPSGSASPPPPQYIATGAPASGAPSADGEWGDVPRLPPILQVEKQHVTTTATQAASASRRRNDAQFKCPVPGCGSTFTRRFNLRGEFTSAVSCRLLTRAHQVICARTPRSGRLFASGQIAARDLPGSMTASATMLCTTQSPTSTCVTDAARPFRGQMRSTVIVRYFGDSHLRTILTRSKLPLSSPLRRRIGMPQKCSFRLIT